MRKLLATDLDGTLLKDNKIPKENSKSVYKLQKNKDLLVISTGRPYNGIEMIKEDKDIAANYYILLNGALIMDALGKKIYHKVIKKDIIRKIVDDVKDDNVNISLESGYLTYVLSDGVDVPYSNTKRVNTVDEINEELSLISIYSPMKDINEIESIKNSINEKYGASIIAYRNDIYIDVVPLGCSKGNALKSLVKQENIIEENVYAIGDSWNDLSMFKVAKNSFTFHHVEKELKEHVSHLVSSVAECIDKFIIKN